MIRFILILFALIFATLLSCATPNNPKSDTPTDVPSSTTIDKTQPAAASSKSLHVSTAVKGLYLSGGTTSARSVLGRSLVSASGSVLGGITPAGVPTTLVFQDANNLPVSATVGQALQLTPDYVLVSYTVAGVSTTAVLKMSTGALASLGAVPDNWAGVVVHGSTAWYESVGTIYSANLDTGAVVLLTANAAVYQAAGSPGIDNLPMGTTSAWDSSALIYVDGTGTVFVADCTNSQNIRAVAVAPSGFVTNIGMNYGAYMVASMTVGAFNGPFVTDSVSGRAFYALGMGEWSNDPLAIGGASQTGYAFQAYPITFSTSGVTTWNSVLPVAGVHLFGNSTGHYQTMTRLGYGVTGDNTMWSDGIRAVTISFSGGVPSLTCVDVSSVPAIMPLDSTGGFTGQVTNFKYTGGKLYFGPATAQTVGVVDGSGSPHVLATGVGTLAGWAAVGGVLFWSDNSGSWQAPVQGTALGIVTAYAGGTVTGITN